MHHFTNRPRAYDISYNGEDIPMRPNHQDTPTEETSLLRPALRPSTSLYNTIRAPSPSESDDSDSSYNTSLKDEFVSTSPAETPRSSRNRRVHFSSTVQVRQHHVESSEGSMRPVPQKARISFSDSENLVREARRESLRIPSSLDDDKMTESEENPWNIEANYDGFIEDWSQESTPSRSQEDEDESVAGCFGLFRLLRWLSHGSSSSKETGSSSSEETRPTPTTTSTPTPRPVLPLGQIVHHSAILSRHHYIWRSRKPRGPILRSHLVTSYEPSGRARHVLVGSSRPSDLG
ncbi:hypothetical protein G7046_g3515 [Stylonectria norvegica]|nr:hypothetical protein G7046_g3515 [Stylonectria norvegica]